MSIKLFTRKIHYWLSAIIAVPLLIIIISGLFLTVRKDVAWVQPPTVKGSTQFLTGEFSLILDQAKTVEKASIQSWADIARVDIRPSKGIIKVLSKNNWEIQLDSNTADILQVAYRRTGVIESIHDGSFFHENISYFVFLPSALILLILWVTGMYMFVVTLISKISK
jgi:uncharacterized iron-regulated membrane protein